MAKINGQLVICDRCKAEVFRKCTGEGERDGGYTRWSIFEDLPNGWGNHNGDLCPDCYREWNRLETEFKNKEIEFMIGG